MTLNVMFGSTSNPKSGTQLHPVKNSKTLCKDGIALAWFVF